MIVWVDAQLPPRTARWIQERFSLDAKALRDLGLRDAEDFAIYSAARDANAVMMTKDADFVCLFERYGSPPNVLWLTCGNTSEKTLQELLERHLPTALELFDSGEGLVEISG